MKPIVDVVIPTVGRPSLRPLVASLAAFDGRVIVVDDRRDPYPALELAAPAGDASSSDASPAHSAGIEIRTSGGRGPAAARNVGWRASEAAWTVFLDDDVRLPDGWASALEDDLVDLPPDVAGSQAQLRVPLPGDRQPTDWERNVASLEGGRWLTADLAYRRGALVDIGGFDERFTRAYREDADIGLRMVGAGWRIVEGARTVEHPVRPAPWWVSVSNQSGNADDVLMRHLHGRHWHAAAGAPRGRRSRHLAITGAGALGAVALVTGHRRVAAGCAAAWATGTAELAWARIAPGPRTVGEVGTMVATSVVIPFVASARWLQGWARLVRLRRAEGPVPQPGGQGEQAAGRPAGASEGDDSPGAGSRRFPSAVLLDRDGTLVVDVPYNGDPALVSPMPGAVEAVERLRQAGMPTAVVSNQSGIARGLLSWDDVHAVDRRIVEVFGPLGPWAVCPHGDDDHCDCRKPAPGLVLHAAELLGVAPADIVVIGDIGADVQAATAAGAAAVLVPTDRTRAEEVAAAPVVVDSIGAAVDLVLRGGVAPLPPGVPTPTTAAPAPSTQPAESPPTAAPPAVTPPASQA